VPLIFETMVFGESIDQEQDRYGTLEEAKQGHARMLARVLQLSEVDAHQN
jgi:hypothetical protein